MMKSVCCAFLFMAFLGLQTGAHAAGEGTAVGVNPDAVARVKSSDRILQVGADVSVGELIVTGAAGQVQIVFDDQTRLVVGPGSSLLIETYLMASNNTAQKLTINALGGSFRFITGNSPKPAYSITTPTAAIAVRGTIFDLIVAPRETAVMLFEGAVQLCGRTGGCRDIVDRCEIGTASTGNVGRLSTTDAEHRPLAQQFRYARFQSPLLSPFRVDGAIFCTEDRAVTPPFGAETGGSSYSEVQTPPTTPPTTPTQPLP